MQLWRAHAGRRDGIVWAVLRPATGGTVQGSNPGRREIRPWNYRTLKRVSVTSVIKIRNIHAPHRGHGCLSVVSVVVSATSWSLVQRSPTNCDASLCVILKPQEWGGHGPRWAAAPLEKENIIYIYILPNPLVLHVRLFLPNQKQGSDKTLWNRTDTDSK